MNYRNEVYTTFMYDTCKYDMYNYNIKYSIEIFI